MADKKKTYWIGDDGDNKSVCINRTVFGRGDAIPVEDVQPDTIKEWEGKGLISIGENVIPVVVRDTEAVKKLEEEIRILKGKLEPVPALIREKGDLEKALEKARSGKKADKLKEIGSRLKECEAVGLKRGESIDELEQDVQEKDALIKKQAEEIEGLEKQVDELTAPKGVGDAANTDDDDNDSGGPQ